MGCASKKRPTQRDSARMASQKIVSAGVVLIVAGRGICGLAARVCRQDGDGTHRDGNKASAVHPVRAAPTAHNDQSTLTCGGQMTIAAPAQSKKTPIAPSCGLPARKTAAVAPARTNAWATGENQLERGRCLRCGPRRASWFGGGISGFVGTRKTRVR